MFFLNLIKEYIFKTSNIERFFTVIMQDFVSDSNRHFLPAGTRTV